MPEITLKREDRHLTKTILEYNLYTVVIFEEGSKVSPKLNWAQELRFNKLFKN